MSSGFDLANQHFGDLNLEDSPPGTLHFWVGDCCGYCTPNPVRVRFEGVSSVHGLDEDGFGYDDPYFRLASSAEAQAHELIVPEMHTAYCVETGRVADRDGPVIFIVARAVHVELLGRGSDLPQ